ncbi:hypothetical protein [Demequina sp.]|uniref:hypothetical protein n=1 Tax=Demequina sp. TaxID=2050685 RepID=UPI003D1211EF
MVEASTTRTRVFVDIDGVLNVDRPDLSDWSEKSWRRRQVYIRSHGIRVWVTYSTSVVDALREIAALPGVEMMWCTTWEAAAPEAFGREVGIGTGWPHVASAAQPADADWWKAAAVKGSHKAGYRVVWLDDEIDSWICRPGRPDSEVLGAAWVDNAEVLTVSCDPRIGLTDAEVVDIQEFIAIGRRPRRDDE